MRFQRAHTRAQRQTSTARSRAKIASHSSSLSQRSPPPLAIVTARQGLGEQGEEGRRGREEGEKRGQEGATSLSRGQNKKVIGLFLRNCVSDIESSKSEGPFP